uniref:Uncharacterized protein n=1 Tax=Kalanchoe fedtschenkoi TaxID=63787 RepID=A0A7N0UX04_KALFE
MKRRASHKSTAAELLDSPLPVATTPSPAHRSADSPPSFDFKSFSRKSSAGNKRKATAAATATASARGLKSSVSPAGVKSLSSISDVKELAAAEMESIKRTVDRSHAEIMKEFEASLSRLNKRFKMQMQTCQQVMDEAEKDYKKMSERITETQDAMKASYAEFIAEAQASASRACKTSIPELSQSVKKSIDGLQSRYGTT